MKKRVPIDPRPSRFPGSIGFLSRCELKFFPDRGGGAELIGNDKGNRIR